MNSDHRTRIERVRSRLAQPLPGHDDFRELSGYQRPDLATVMRQTPAPKESAVLVLLYPHLDQLHTMLMLRPAYDGVHSGQVGFPGGHREADDADIIATALREFQEETGAGSGSFDVLGTLSQVYIPPSRTIVTPVMAYAEELGQLRPDPHEVAALIPVSVDDLLQQDILKRTSVHIKLFDRYMEVPYWDVKGHVVWGATAMMIAEMRKILAH